MRTKYIKSWALTEECLPSAPSCLPHHPCESLPGEILKPLKLSLMSPPVEFLSAHTELIAPSLVLLRSLCILILQY